MSGPIRPIRPPRSGVRSPLLAGVRRLLVLAARANEPGAPPADELAGQAEADRLTRRAYLRGAAAALASPAITPGPRRSKKRPRPGSPAPPARSPGNVHAPRIVVVGAGIAGLNATYRLKRNGFPATLYSADERIGGRIVSRTGLVAPGITTELGGEFIDTGHLDMRALAFEFGLPLIDLESDPISRTAYYFGGTRLTNGQIIEAFRPLAARIRADAAQIPDRLSYRIHTPRAVQLDQTPLEQYLEQAGVSGPLLGLLNAAYVTEDGVELGEQSALNLVWSIGTDLSEGFQLFGSSDERFKVVGGNQRIVEALASAVADRIEPGHTLAAIQGWGSGFLLSFATSNGAAVQVPADHVILALPFSTLRAVELLVPLPPIKRLAIEQLAYGTNAKVLIGVRDKPWRAQGFSGDAFSEGPLQSCWDGSQLQGGPAGELSVLAGGLAGLSMGAGSPELQALRFLPLADRIFPGVQAAFNGRAGRAYWPGDPFVRASYSTYGPGQYTAIGGAQSFPVGNLHFAGEHTNHPDLGYMNGGARTGRLAAESVMARVRRG